MTCYISFLCRKLFESLLCSSKSCASKYINVRIQWYPVKRTLCSTNFAAICLVERSRFIERTQIEKIKKIIFFIFFYVFFLNLFYNTQQATCCLNMSDAIPQDEMSDNNR